jgi:hypothetical protein
VIIADPVELRQKSFSVLVAELGWVNAVRFVQQHERGEGDYTRERDAILPAWDAPTLVREARRRAKRARPRSSR